MRGKHCNIYSHAYIHTLWCFPEKLKFNSKIKKTTACAQTHKLLAPCLHLRTWQRRSAVVWGQGHSQAQVEVKDQQIWWFQSLGGPGWCGWGAAQGSQRWRWWREAARSCRLDDPGISLAEGAKVVEVSGVGFIIYHFEVWAISSPSV